jgi:hypothetical protein
VLLQIDFEKSLPCCRKGEIDMEVEVMTSAESDMVPTTFDFADTCAFGQRIQ